MKVIRKYFCLILAILLAAAGFPSMQHTQAATAKTMPAASKSTPVGKNGRLSVSGNKIVNKSGKTFVIKGISTHGLSWFPEYVNKASFKTLRDDFGVNTIRLAMYTSEYNGYCTGDTQNKKQLKKLVDQGIQYATELGMYVIVDWHILNDGNPKLYQKESVAFFKEMAGKYKSYTNIIYEICNEPNGGEGSWENIQSYSKAVIKAIRKIDKKAIIVVGTPTWSQDVDIAAKQKITGYKNIAYAFHFYADTHREALREKLQSAVESGLPVVVTEFGITSASVSGAVNKSEGNKWISLLDQYSIGRVCWNLSNKDEASALLKASCTKTDNWSAADLSEQGKWLLKVYTGKTKTSNTGTNNNSGDNSGNDAGSNSGNPNDNGSSDSSGNTGVSKSGTGTKDNKKIKATAALTNSWEQDGAYYYLYTVDLKGAGTSRTSKWTATLTFSAKPSFTQGWCGKYSKKDKAIIIKSESYNGKLKKGENTQAGFIISSKKKISLKKITIKCS